MMNVRAAPSFPVQWDLCHQLSAASSNSRQELLSFSAVFDYAIRSKCLDGTFPLKFSRRVQWINSLLRKIDASNSSKWVPERMQSRFFASQISECLSDVIEFHTRQGFHLRTAQAICALAQELKRHQSIRKAIWLTLPIQHQTMLDRVTPWFENLSVLSTSASYQWLGDGHLERAKQHGECLTDFGGGRLFRVLPPVVKNGKTVFPLAGNRDFDLFKTSQRPIPSLSSPLDMLQVKKWGRIQELFDVNLLMQKVDQGEEPDLYLNQFRTLASCYRSALCAALDLSTVLPKAMGRLGEWTIWPSDIRPFDQGSSLDERQLEDLHRFFALEKLWSIALLADKRGEQMPQWVTSDAALLQQGLLPLPTFFDGDMKKRHQDLLETFNLDEASLEHWEKLEEKAVREKELVDSQMQGLQDLLDLKKMTPEDLTKCSPPVLRWIRLLSHLKISPVNNGELARVAEEMFSLLLPTTQESPYTADVANQSKGLAVTEHLLALKQKFKAALACAALIKMEMKETEEEWLSSFLTAMKEECSAAGDGLLKSDIASCWAEGSRFENEDVKKHLLLYCDEFMQEWTCFFKSPITDKESLYGQLLCLKKRAALPGSDPEAMNARLQSVLHDAMVHQYSQKFMVEFQHMMLQGSEFVIR